MALYSDLGRAKRVDKDSTDARINGSYSGEGCSGSELSEEGTWGGRMAARFPVSFEIEQEVVRTRVEN